MTIFVSQCYKSLSTYIYLRTNLNQHYYQNHVTQSACLRSLPGYQTAPNSPPLYNDSLTKPHARSSFCIAFRSLAPCLRCLRLGCHSERRCPSSQERHLCLVSASTRRLSLDPPRSEARSTIFGKAIRSIHARSSL